ncbi:MFS transporter [Francisella sp. SYW-9]|uniref:MFS transporter n=1 Tax=Francisella sp. SYW-9 TaxID=2610888 RepID=UPI00123D53F0|nr:MFS transporter [Francisella sp. SYW-9]
MPNHTKSALSFVLLTWFLGNLNVYFFMPFLPLIKHDFMASAVIVQYTISIFYICKAGGMLIFGTAGEIIGRRKVMLIGIAMICIASFVSLFITDMRVLLICRMFQGLGVSATVLMGRTIINDIYEGKEAARVFSKIMFAACIIITLLPILGGYVAKLDSYKIAFFVIMAYTLVIGLFAYFFLPETSKTENKEKFEISAVFKYYLTVIRERYFLAFILCTIFVVAGESVFDTASPLLMMNTYGFSTISYGYFVSFMSLISWVGILAAGVLLKKYSLEEIMGVGAILSLISGLIILLQIFSGTIHLAFFIISMIAFFLGSGFILTVFNVGVVKNHQKTVSIASSASLFLYFSCSALGSFIISHFSNKTIMPLAIAMIILCFIVFLFWLVLLAPLIRLNSKQNYA